MNTMKAEYKTDIARLAEDMAKRDKDNIKWLVGLWIASTIIIVGSVGLMLRISGV